MKQFNLPSFTITPRILELVASVSEKSGMIKSLLFNNQLTKNAKKRKYEYLAKSMSIDDNSFTKDDIENILGGNTAVFSVADIAAVQNFASVYSKIGQWHPYSIDSFFYAQKMLRQGLCPNAGNLRTDSVGIRIYRKKISTTPDAKQIPLLIESLFSYIKTSRDLLLIKSCVFYHQIIFIHPFDSGNAQMARIWLKVLLNEYNSIFGKLPFENEIANQKDVLQRAILQCKGSGKSNQIIEFILTVLDNTLLGILEERPNIVGESERIEMFKRQFKQEFFSRKDYLGFFKNISTATASRDLKTAVKEGVIFKTGSKNQTIYTF